MDGKATGGVLPKGTVIYIRTAPRGEPESPALVIPIDHTPKSLNLLREMAQRLLESGR